MTPELENRIKEKIKTDRDFRRTLRDYLSTLRTYPKLANEDALFEYASRNEKVLFANADRSEKMIKSLDIPTREWIQFTAWISNNKGELEKLVKESSVPWWKRMFGL